MGLTKSGLFTKKHKQIVATAKAIAHPPALLFYTILQRSTPAFAAELMEELGPAWATISQHLKELKAVRLIQGTFEGTSICYCIDPKVWNPYRKMFTTFFKEVASTDCCWRFLPAHSI